MSKFTSTSGAKGLKYQSYFTIYFLLKHAVESEKKNSFDNGFESNTYVVGLEMIDDVLIKDIITEDNYIQQLKNTDHKMTINSDEVKKTIRNFYYIFKEVDFRDNYFFNFVTPSKITKDLVSSILDEDDIKYLRTNNLFFLEILKQQNIEHMEFAIKIIRKILGFEDETNDCWIETLIKRITWSFNYLNLEELKEESCKYIKHLNDFDSSLVGKEEIIFSFLAEKAEYETSKKAPLYVNRFNRDTIRLAFYEIKTNAYKQEYATDYELSEDYKLTTRDLNEKIVEICPDINSIIIKKHIQDITLGKYELETKVKQKTNGYLITIYRAATDFYINEILNKKRNIDSEKEMNLYLEEQFLYVKQKIEDHTLDYGMIFKSDDMIFKTIKILFNECFLEFKEIKEGI